MKIAIGVKQEGSFKVHNLLRRGEFTITCHLILRYIRYIRRVHSVERISIM